MNYVKYFNINGVNTKQVACIEVQGVPNAATEGAVGVLAMDMLSPTHEVYRCVAVKGSVYTWELLSAGMSIISAVTSGEGALTESFSYENLRIPNNYIIKPGDLILDSEGYLYQINTIGNTSCEASYCGTHIGGIASGDKDRSLVIKDGKLQLVTESGNVLSEVDTVIPDGDTLHRDASTGETHVRGVKTINDHSVNLFYGTYAEYNGLSTAQKSNLIPYFTDGGSGVAHCIATLAINGLADGSEFYLLASFVVNGVASSMTPNDVTTLINAMEATYDQSDYLPASGWCGENTIVGIRAPYRGTCAIVGRVDGTRSTVATLGSDSFRNVVIRYTSLM